MMRALNRFFMRLFNFTARRRGDERLKEEIELHLECQTEENIRAGLTPGEARRRARMKFGVVEAVQEDYRAETGLPFVEDLLMDVRYAHRMLRRSPTFTVVALLTLMVGIGANMVVLGVLNALLLQPLGVSDPQALYQIRNGPRMSGGMLTMSYPAFEEFRQRNTTFEDLAAIYGYSEAALNWRNTVAKIRGCEVTGNYFELLGIRPERGRFFHATDEHGPNSAPYVVLSDHTWRSAFHAEEGVIGTMVKLNGHPFTVIGVASSKFHGTERFEWPDYWIPMANEQQVEGWDYLHNRTSAAVMAIGRLKPGVTPEQATEDLNAIGNQLANEYPKTDKGVSVRLIRPGLFGDDGEIIRGFLYGVTALVLLLLTAAWANLASLFATRAADRSRELALRVALGSSRFRLARQLLTEAMIVSLIGGVAGLVSANLLLAVLNRWRPAFGYGGQRLALNVELDARVYLAGLALTLGSGLLFGVMAVRQAWRGSPLQMIKGNPVNSIHLLRGFTFRDFLLGGQIAICTLLITASLVAVRGMVRAMNVPLGIKPEGAMLAEMDFRQVGQEDDGVPEKQKAMIEAARRIPGVTAVGAARTTPMGGGKRGSPVYRPEATEFTPNNYVLMTRIYAVSPKYLAAAGTRLLNGRDVSWHDTTDVPYVGIVNKTFAQKMWGKTPAIGQRFLLSGHLTEVVGIAEDGKYHDLIESPQAAVYVPLSQNQGNAVVFVVRSQLAPSEIAPALQRTLSGIEPNVPITVKTWSNALASVFFPMQAATVVLGLTGFLGATLAMTGIFGMAAYNVTGRMKELGIRMALGARRTLLMSAAVGRPALLLLGGSSAGLLAGIFASPFFSRMVYQGNPSDPTVLAGVVLTMVMIGIAGSALPARRALSVDPSLLMREE